ncbi:MAG TPA: sugar ABC transporter permease [Candidatus Limiplasma sp.]|nr:sugar ABC transporter permease [Candidatus Limiplasma sp.]
MLLSKKRQSLALPISRIAPARKSLLSAAEPYLYLLPAFAVFGVFLFYPFFRTIYLSAFLTNKYGQARVFVGLGNYIDIFSSSSFWNSLWITLQFVLMVAVGGLVMGLITSLLTAKAFPGHTLAAATYAMPVAIASAAASMTFRMILHPTNGLLNNLLGTSVNWRGDPAWALLSVAAMTIWLSSGINFIFLSAGLRNIPDAMYEAAAIDGAGYFGKLWHITLPSLSPTLFFQIIINIIYAFQSFSQIRLLTDGGPGEATNVIVYAIYRDAFFNFRFGTASARSVVLFIIIMAITLVQFSMEKRSVHY